MRSRYRKWTAYAPLCPVSILTLSGETCTQRSRCLKASPVVFTVVCSRPQIWVAAQSQAWLHSNSRVESKQILLCWSACSHPRKASGYRIWCSDSSRELIWVVCSRPQIRVAAQRPAWLHSDSQIKASCILCMLKQMLSAWKASGWWI